MNIGDIVSIQEPFNVTYPGSYTVVAVRDDKDITCTIDIDGVEVDFASKFLVKVNQ